LFEGRVRNIHDVDEQVGLPNLVQRALKAFDELGRQLANKPDGVGEQEGHVVIEHHLAGCGIDGGEKFIFGKDFGLAEQVFKLFLEEGDAVAHDASVGLDFRFTGAFHAHTTALLVQVSPEAGEAGQEVLVLRQLDLRARRADVGLFELLHKAFGSFGAGRFNQKGQLIKVFSGLRVALAARGYAHEHSSFALFGRGIGFSAFEQVARQLGIAAGRRAVGSALVPGAALAVVVFRF
nr:hypothetical protein [Tanacetum cinerariifolium]